MRSLEDFIRNNSPVLRATAIDAHAIRNWITESSDKQAAARDAKQPAGNRVDSAYDAMHMGCLAVLMTEAYRVTSAAGHHKELLEAVCNRIGGSTGYGIAWRPRWMQGTQSTVAHFAPLRMRRMP